MMHLPLPSLFLQQARAGEDVEERGAQEEKEKLRNAKE